MTPKDLVVLVKVCNERARLENIRVARVLVPAELFTSLGIWINPRSATLGGLQEIELDGIPVIAGSVRVTMEFEV